MKKYLIIFAILVGKNILASDINPDYANRLVSAIYKAEGGEKAKVPYGILSVKVNGTTPEEKREQARKICLKTVQNNWHRWENAGKTNDFITFLSHRYCPPEPDNSRWQKNVRYFLDKDKEKN